MGRKNFSVFAVMSMLLLSDKHIENTDQIPISSPPRSDYDEKCAFLSITNLHGFISQLKLSTR